MKTKTYIFLLMTLVLIMPVTANAIIIKASKHYITKKVDVPKFTSIKTNSSIDIEFSESANQSVSIYAPDNLMEYIKVSVSNGELYVSYNTSNSIHSDGKCNTKLIISAPNVNSFKTHGSGDIKIMTPIKSNKLINMQITGSGDITANSINCDKLTLTIQGSGDIDLNGPLNARKATLEIQGSGDINLKGTVTIDEIDISTKGSGDVSVTKVNATTVKCSTYGSGDIDIKGECTNSNFTLMGSGDISAKGLKTQNRNINSHGSGTLKI